MSDVVLSWSVYLRLGVGVLLLTISNAAESRWVDILFFVLAWLMLTSGARVAYREGRTVREST